MDDPTNNPAEIPEALSHEDALRLKAFLRDAEAIISTERGLNASGQRKLQSLARHQQLPTRLLELAMQQLQESEQTTTKLSRYELAFVKFLDGEFKKLHSDVLSLQGELVAIEMAQTKYQIPRGRAEHLIGQQARTAGLVRIARSEAEEYAIRFIAKQIGNRQALSDEFREHLHQRGSKLGLSVEQIDQEILKQLALNRQSSLSVKGSALRIVGLATICLAVLAAAGLIVGRLTLSHPQPMAPVSASADDKNIPADDQELDAHAPSWLLTSTVQQIRIVASTNLSSLNLESQLFSSDPKIRATGYHLLSRAAMEDTRDQRELIESLVCELFFEEPDSDAIFGLIDEVRERIRLVDQPADQAISVQRNRLEQQYDANRFLAHIFFHQHNDPIQQSLIGERQQTLAMKMSAATGILPTGKTREDYLKQSAANIAVDQWNYLIKNSWSHPGNVAGMTQPVCDLTQPHLSDKIFESLRSRLIQSILENHPAQWLNLKRPFRATILATDDSELINWITLVLDTSDNKFKEFSSPILLRHAKIPEPSTTLKLQLSQLEDFAIGYRNQVLQPMLLRHQRIDSSTISLLESFTASEPWVTPDRIAQVALLTNLNFAIGQRIQTGNVSHDDDFSIVDEMLEQKKIRLRDLVSLPDSTGARQPAANPTASDINRQSLALRRISNQEADQINGRMRAIQQLESIASRFSDLDYENATILARYFLEPYSDEEAMNIQQRISAFTIWPMLGVAIADQIAASTVSRDRALTIANLFFHQEFEIEDTQNEWRTALQIQLLNATQRNLAVDLKSSSHSNDSDWSRLSIWLAGCYRQRDSWINDKSETMDLEVDASPFEILSQLVETALKQFVDGSDEIRLLQRQLDLIQQDSKNELIRIVQTHQLLINLLASQANRKSGADSVNPTMSEIQKLIADFDNRLQPNQIGDLLFLSELKLLEQTTRRRHQLIENSLR